MSLSIIIPCFNEEDNIKQTVESIKSKITVQDYEVILINDFSTDDTEKEIISICKNYNFVKYYNNTKKGLGTAIEIGIENSNKIFVVILMADLSDNIMDLNLYYQNISSKKVDAVFGSRFLKNSSLEGYPLNKLFLNRFFNYVTKLFFWSDYNDFTNAFKIYRKEVLIKLKPFVSENFNIFLEIPLKIISRKYKYIIIPISWKNRKFGDSKFKIVELGSKYLFTLLYCWLEKVLIKK